MAEFLSIYWRFLDQPSVEWCLSNEQGILNRGTGTLASVSQQLGEQIPSRIELWLGGEQLLQVAVRAPTQKQALLEAAAPYLAEEYLAQDINDVHLALAKVSGSRLVEVCVVDKSKFHSLMQQLTEIGLAPDVALPDFLGISSTEAGVLALDSDNERALLRLNRMQEGGACGLSGSLELVIGALSQMQPPEAQELPGLAVIGGSTEVVQQLQASLPSWRILPVDQPESSLIAQLRGSSRHTQINLCQGPYQKRRRQKTVFYTLARRLVAACVLLVFASLLIKIAWFEVKTLQLEAQSRQLYVVALPDQLLSEAEIDRQLRILLRQSGDTSIAEFLHLISLLNVAAEQLGDHQFKVELVKYQYELSNLAVELLVSSFEQLDRLDHLLSEAGLLVDISSARQRAEVVHAELRLQSRR